MKFLIHFFLLLFSTLFFSQNARLSDAEYQKLHDKARLLINSNIDSSFSYADKIEKSNNNLHKSFAFGIKSYLYQLKGDSIKSKQLYKQSFVYLDKVPASIEKTKHQSYLLAYGGLAEWKRGNFSNALELYLKGKKLSVQVDDIAQIIKFNTNISLINGNIQNYKLAISSARESELLLDQFKKSFTEEQYENNKSNIYLGLGNYYADYYWLDKSKTNKLDSAAFFYKKAIMYSNELLNNKIRAQAGITNVYQLQNKNSFAEKSYLNLLFTIKENKLDEQYYDVCYNVGRFYFQLKKYDKSIVYFSKVDSLNSKHNYNTDVFVNTNYYLSKIYEIKDDPENAVKYSEIYLDNFEKNEFKKIDESAEVNSVFEKLNLKKEMIETKKRFGKEVLIKKWLSNGLLLLFVAMTILLIKNIIDKNKVKLKFDHLMEEFSNKVKEKDSESIRIEGVIAIEKQSEKTDEKIVEKQSIAISMDEAKERQILSMLKTLEEKKFYLRAEFNQQEVAKKLKTNTTYLSYVVNKKFEKSFSDYVNELKINYAINEMIMNPIYRKYSTQAIAESVGFKNAISFTKSFHKRTGVTPVQFIKRINY